MPAVDSSVSGTRWYPAATIRLTGRPSWTRPSGVRANLRDARPRWPTLEKDKQQVTVFFGFLNRADSQSLVTPGSRYPGKRHGNHDNPNMASLTDKKAPNDKSKYSEALER
jgi:hypothetical protein